MSNEVDALLEPLVRELEQGYGLGSMSCSIYDTAWVACISKPSSNGVKQWLFPSSFTFVLDSQHADGGWHWPPQGTDECVDSTTLTSLAALFAITQHIKQPLQLIRLQHGLDDQLKRGIEFLAKGLQHFGSTSRYSVGTEVLVPALLELLEKDGIKFQFSGRQALFQRRDAKLSQVPKGKLDKLPSTILHSLEALYGDTCFTFDTLRNRLVHGSMMASPSATAAYLMRCNEWDESAEAYLRLVLSNGAGQGSGAVPSAFPSTNFEFIWVAATLLKAGCIEGSCPATNGGQVLRNLVRRITENGLVGFAPGIIPDVDDSATASIVLSLMGEPGLSRQISEEFETETHFETYKNESNESLSANCSILLAFLLDLNHNIGAVSAIEKVSRYLASIWFNANGPVKDKWNVSEFYTTMLLAQAFIKLFQCWEAGELAPLGDEVLRNRIMLAAFRSLIRTLHTQNTDGSWGSNGPLEETAYAILALVELSGLPMASFLHQPIHSAILNGRNYLKAHEKPDRPEYLWVEKVLYGAGNLSQAYIFAAMKTPRSHPMDCHRLRSLLKLDYEELAMFTSLFQKVPMLASQPRWLIHASWIEGQLFLPMLHEIRQAVFSRTGMTKDKYVAWIPIMWTLANNTNRCDISARLLFDMMRVSVLNFQVDEFMETVVDAQYRDDITTVRGIIENIFQNIDPTGIEKEQARIDLSTTGTRPPNNRGLDTNSLVTATDDVQPTIEIQLSKNVSAPDSQPTSDTGPFPLSTDNDHNTAPSAHCSSIFQPLQSFINYIAVLTSTALVSLSSQVHIRELLKAFLNAHVTQIHLNRSFSSSPSSKERKSSATTSGVLPISMYTSLPTPNFRIWLHNVAATHTSAPYSMALYLALLARGGTPSLLRTPKQHYVVEDLAGCLARMCRLYNDWGSVDRDRGEGNLNCVDFAELRDTAMSECEDEDAVKERVMALADWERKGVERAMEELEREGADERLVNGLRVFVDVTDLFGQVYVVKDLASRKV